MRMAPGRYPDRSVARFRAAGRATGCSAGGAGTATGAPYTSGRGVNSGPAGQSGRTAILLSLRRRRRRRLALTLLRLDHGKTGRRAEVLGGGRRWLDGRGRLLLLGGHLLLGSLRLLLTRLLLNKLGVLLLLLDVLRGGRQVEGGGGRLRRAGERTGRRWVARGGLVAVVGFLRGWRVRGGARGLAVAVRRRAEHDQ